MIAAEQPTGVRGKTRVDTQASRFVWVTCLLSACTFGGSGVAGGGPGGLGSGGATTTDGGTVGDASASTTQSDSSQSTGPHPGTLSTPTGVDASSGDEVDAAAGTTGDTASTGEDTEGSACTPLPPFAQVIWASDALVNGPMQKWDMPNLPGLFCVASETADNGEAIFPWVAPCDGDYYVWAHVWDDRRDILEPDNTSADSYYVRLDNDSATYWRYGCQNGELDPAGAWEWQPVQNTTLCVGGKSDVTFNVAAGAHSFVFRNREAGTFDVGDAPGDVAAIARILVSNDPDYSPSPAD